MRARCLVKLWSIIITVALAQISSGQALLPADRPNIIVILADDLGYGDLGCYGQTKIKTPNIDSLAAEGIRFTQCYAGSTASAASRCALLTGRHTGHGLIRGDTPAVPLRPEDQTITELLKRAGYHTGAFGKWALGLEGTTGEPNKKGFEEWLGYLDQAHADEYYPSFLWRNGQRYEFNDNFMGRRAIYVQDVLTQSALNFIRIYSADRPRPDRRFFLYLAYTLPHPNVKLARQTGNGMETPSDAPYTEEAWPQVEKNKAAMISRLDSDLGRLVADLRTRNLASKTVIFLTSDNGPHKAGGNDPAFFQSSGPLRGIKGDLYEGGIRVPMIVWWPGAIKPAVSDFPWAFWDFLPTAAQIGRAPALKDIDGQSIVPTLLGQTQKPSEFLYWESHEVASKQAVRMGDWKAVLPAPDKPLELYNLKSDIAERANVASSNPGEVAKIEAYLKTARSNSQHWPLKE